MGLGGHINAKSYSDKNGPAARARAREALELQIRLSVIDGRRETNAYAFRFRARGRPNRQNCERQRRHEMNPDSASQPASQP